MFYFNTNIPGRIFLQNTSCIGKRQVISQGGGGTPCTFPLDLPLHAMQLTELVCMVIMTMDSEIPGKTSPQGMHIQYLKKKKTKLFLKTCQFRPQMWYWLAAKWHYVSEPGRGLYPSSFFLLLW